MKTKAKLPGIRHHRYLRVAVITAICGILYYLPHLTGMASWVSAASALDNLHDLFGLDVYALLFFIPVVYVAYTTGVIRALLTSLAAMVILIPYAVLFSDYPAGLLRPAAFFIILSAVGAVVAMLQKTDLQRRRSLSELRCLYEIGSAVDESNSVQQFAGSAVNIIARHLRMERPTGVKLIVREKEYLSWDFAESAQYITEELRSGGETLGTLQICSTGHSYLDKEHELIRTLAERLGSAVRQIELQLALESHYGLMEDMVEERTRDLEMAQEKLIRSERLAAVGELASGVGHELRNPLNVIRNCVYLLNLNLDSKLDGEATETLKVLDRQVDIANRIVTDLLEFTRVSPPALSRVDLNSLVRESSGWVSAPPNVALKFATDKSVPPVLVDAQQVGRAFANIIANAYQAMSGGGELKIVTGVNGVSAWVRFEDTGCGIPPENMTRIFEPLFTTKPKGVGLGLAITRRLIEQNSGSIEVESQVGKGTTFSLKLPLYREVRDESAK